MTELPKTDAANLFADLADDFMDAYPETQMGSMMSHPGVKLKGRNIVIFWVEADKPVFRLGKAFDAKSFGLTDCEQFNPSKDKPPMDDWYVVGFADEAKWAELFKLSLDQIRSEL